MMAYNFQCLRPRLERKNLMVELKIDKLNCIASVRTGSPSLSHRACTKASIFRKLQLLNYIQTSDTHKNYGPHRIKVIAYGHFLNR